MRKLIEIRARRMQIMVITQPFYSSKLADVALYGEDPSPPEIQ